MHPAFSMTIQLFEDLNGADLRIQSEFQDLLKGYYQFVHAPRREGLKVTNRLVLRADKDHAGRIRRLFWAKRTRAVKRVGERTFHLSNRLTGHFRNSWTYKHARDYRRRDAYWSMERRRASLNSLRSSLVRTLRALRLAFAYAWSRRATPEDLALAQASFSARAALLQKEDLRPLTGAAAHARALTSAEAALGALVEEFRSRFERSVDVSFEPAMRPTDGGCYRLYWGFPHRVGTTQGEWRTFTEYIPGGPTDLWMRRQGLPRATREEVRAFVRRFREEGRRYRSLVAFLGRHRQRAQSVLSRIARREPDVAAAAHGRPILPEGKGIAREAL